MFPPCSRIILIVLFTGLSCSASGQKKTPVAAWIFPGASWSPAKNLRLEGRLGYNDYLRSGLFYPQAFITVHKNIVLNPAYIYIVQKPLKAPILQEHYLFNAIIFQASRKRFYIDDRNMLWNRLAAGAEDRHYYRNRLRVGRSFKTWELATRLYVYDEMFYLFNDHNLARNRAALGVTSDLTAHANVDVTYIRQWDRYAGSLNLFVINLIWQF